MKKVLANKHKQELRKELENLLREYQGDEKIKLNISHELLEMIIFKNADIDDIPNTISFDFELIKKLDLTDISFDGVNITNANFEGCKQTYNDFMCKSNELFENIKSELKRVLIK